MYALHAIFNMHDFQSDGYGLHRYLQLTHGFLSYHHIMSSSHPCLFYYPMLAALTLCSLD